MKPEPRRVTRTKEMLRYVLVRGLLSYGLPMFIFMTLFVQDDLSTRSIGISAVVWTIGGALFGIIMWFGQEREARQAGGTDA